MAEYGGTIRQSTGVGGGPRGGSRDLGGEIMDAVADAVDQIASLPPEVLLALLGIALIAGLVRFRRA